MAGAHSSEASAPTRILLRVMRLWSGTAIGAVKWPSFNNEGWHRSAKFAANNGHIPLLWNHLAAVGQVGEGASLRRDAFLI